MYIHVCIQYCESLESDNANNFMSFQAQQGIWDHAEQSAVLTTLGRILNLTFLAYTCTWLALEPPRHQGNSVGWEQIQVHCNCIYVYRQGNAINR